MGESRVIQLESSWLDCLGEEFNQDYMIQLSAFLREQKRLGKTIFPPGKEIFSAFNQTPFNHVKVVILGQDPYHGPGQAHGLCFSVPHSIAPPPSLRNIYLELQSDLGIPCPAHGCLSGWASQGVLLLNSVLTVERGIPSSHSGIGWECFTDQVISMINSKLDSIVFILWGKYAQNKGKIIDTSKHLLLTAAHPSPFSAKNGFFGCCHFSEANRFLISTGQKAISWEVLLD